MTLEARNATAKGELVGDSKNDEMFKFCGFANMQHQAVRNPQGQLYVTLLRNSKTPQW
jgi:hypothetical protein